MANAALLEIEGLSKSFPGVQALRNVSFQLYPGEVHGLLGENGAGKSTLIKILSGAYVRDSGSIRLNGREVRLGSPLASLEAGIAVMYQELNLVPDLSVAENIFLDRIPRVPGGFINRKELYRRTTDILERLNIDVEPETIVRNLPLAKQQMVEIAKALSHNAKIIAMDEPTAPLTGPEIEMLFETIKGLKQNGTGVIYISHRLEEVWEIADRVTILRDGQHVTTQTVATLDRNTAISLMVGRNVDEKFPTRHSKRGSIVLSVRNLSRKGVLHYISFDLYKGEVLGIAGLVGAGRSELVRAIFGADRFDSGEVFIEGSPITIKNPADAIKNGIVLVSEDRKRYGLTLNRSVHENIMLAAGKRYAKSGFVNYHSEIKTVDGFIEKLSIKTPTRRQFVRNLSGGNQQKVVLAKWLGLDCRVVIFDEPTRGIDVGAKYEIYQLINDLVSNDVGVIMVSSELPEVLGMSDRILVMCEGRVQACLPRQVATQEMIMSYATGERSDAASNR